MRLDHNEDTYISCAFSIVFERRPDLRLEGLAHKVLHWYLCRMEGLDIRLSHKVTKIVRRYNGVKVTVEDGTAFLADAVIVVVPLGVLKAKSIRFEPRLPEWKEAAIDDLGVGIENKIAFHFDKVFGLMWSFWELLLARDIEKMSDEATADFAFMQLRKTLLEASASIQYLVSRWCTDINTLASMTNIPKGVKVRPITIEQRGSPMYYNLIEIIEFIPGMFKSDKIERLSEGKPWFIDITEYIVLSC
ncbi:hypothetical protein CRYUN_Cryun41cG0035500 [Craigia yunnanensis]